MASLEHMLLECKLVRNLRTNIINHNKVFFLRWSQSHWVFGCSRQTTNNLVWVINFVIYKALLQASSGMNPDLNLLIKSTFARYAKIYLDIDLIDLSFLDGVDTSTPVHR